MGDGNEGHGGCDGAVADVVVIGGGLGGLATAAMLARQGRSVTLLEKASSLGGRAATHVRDGFSWNLGPHAVYRGGRGLQILTALGVPVTGGVPSTSGNFALLGGVKHMLPVGFFSLVSTGLLSLSAKLEIAKLLASIARLDPRPLAEVSVSAWIDSAARQPGARALLHALVRVATYADAPTVQSAGAALAQLQMAAADNVLYVDGGWATLVSGLRAVAAAAGAELVTSARVARIEPAGGDHPRRVRLDDGRSFSARTVVLAGGPGMAHAVCPEVPVLASMAARSIPVRAACLDVALTSLPRPSSRFILGIDRPYYASLHSAVARLAPEGGATIHLAKYLAREEKAGEGVERELLDVLDLLQPGWRQVVADRRFLPSMTVSHAVVTAADGGLPGRPPPSVPGAPGLFVVGDWVGPEGMLLDASLASAESAAAIIDAELGLRVRPSRVRAAVVELA